ncbi:MULTISPECIES: prepilin-type N-terminal cleavage/methylation domain-containing protein [Alteromonadaceae]|uniref:prepilin-type N-terminal cleavage/methylation domain-containing protein n=1 Tax=Alteromonadaceae TaxID=72275 RepID=UPI001C09B4C9|nr:MULTISPECIES: prepilin-type N-terminal cleavage/methylation domain-containing protein [Aliiglaciecola]MBU2880201.1 prepilin-type N-terminal cleavage/methylation domain-containing protein [Aliiglaciecola lipolytica]MDO6713215.1 prepilin-type N-terminal cleavage/methylation domain-containing protein [Aliiglaciecola sp. 2_MG-2023]MDO6754347.1 prepilin-type N-terminal cleavage/methylation domain-containing protein [Aliiglaciecola sp. 1_MG-2023]
MASCKHKGFTLIELITVLVVLSVVSVGIAGFIRTGTEIYVDVVERDKLLSQGRFAVQRMNLEINNALPNSLRIAGNSSIQCLEFTPILFSSFYFDLPVAPEPAADEVKLIATDAAINDYNYESGQSIIVYPTSVDDVYADSDRRFLLGGEPELDPADSKKLLVPLASSEQFETESPSSRAYITGAPVSFCITDNKLYRKQQYPTSSTQSTSLVGAVLMAENIQNDLSGSTQDLPFRIAESSLTRNAFVITLLRFELNEELVVFNNEIHIPNVP